MFYHPHPRVTLDCGDELVTKQAHKDECDIHKILNQYKKTGIITHITSQSPQYLDLPNSLDYQNSINIVLEGQAAFATLPSSVREYFGNDPARFLASFGDPEMRPKLEEWGFINKAPAQTPAPEVPASE